MRLLPLARRAAGALALAGSAALAGCDAGAGPDDVVFTPEVVVESYQVVGDELAPVRFTRTSPVGGRYDPDANAISGVVARIELLTDGGAVEATYPLRPRRPFDGWYDPPEPAPPVLPLRRYRLVAATAEAPGPVTAETVTPGPFGLVAASADTVTYPTGGFQSTENQLTFTVTRPAYPTRQAVFVFTTESLNPAPTLADLVPFLRAFADRDGDGVLDADEPGAEGDEPQIADFRLASSPLLNQANYETADAGTLRIRLPWIAVVIFGANRITASAVDDNLYDFLRSQSVQQGGSTLAPGEIPNVIDRVENGVGVFGSYSRVVREVFVRRPDE